MPQWSCQIVDLRVDSKIAVADNFVGSDSDKSAAETDSAENPAVENIVAAGIWLDFDIVVVIENNSENFADSLRKLLLQLYLLAIMGTCQ